MGTTAKLAKPRWLVPEVVQTSAMDCGPASLKCLLEGFGIAVSYGRLREACQTDLDGTSIDTIEVVANQLGLNAEQVMVPVDHLFLSEAQVLPAIVVVRNPDGSTHFVVAWRRHGGWLQVMDPAIGRRWVPCRRFAEEVFRHELSTLASDWRDWAGTEDFLRPLRQQLAAIGATRQDTATLVDRALKNQYWFGLALVDASVRFIKSVIDAGGLQAGAQSVKLATTLYEQTRENIQDMYKIIPGIYWSAVPDKPVEGEAMKLLLRGAVVLRVAGQKAAGLEAQLEDEKAAEEVAPRSLELIAALSEKPPNPLKKIWDLLLLDGLLGPVALTGAIVIAAAVVLIEILLFRGLFDITGALALPGQRIAALLALMILVVVLMLIEVPIFTETMRYGRHLETRLRMALLQKLPHLNDRYFQSRPVSDMAERGHSIVLTRGVPGLGLQFIQTLCDLSFTLIGIALIDRASLLPAVLLAGVALCIPLLVQPFLNERDLRVRNHSGALHVFYLDALLGLVPIRTHRAEQAVRRQHEGLLVEWARSSRGLIGIVLTTDAVQALVCLGFAGYLLGEHLLRSGGVTGGDLLLIYWTLKLPALGHAFTSLAQQYPAQRNVLLRLLEPLAAPTEGVEEGNVMPAEVRENEAAIESTVGAEIKTGGLAIRIENGKVLASGHTLLQDVDLNIAPGEHIAIVGLSGAGKSTLLGLLLGWHRLAAGDLHVDAAPMTAATQEQLRRATAWVDPAIQIWNRSLLDNLNFASDSEHFEQIGEVLKSADLRGVLQKLPEGLQTCLGEGGALLSGGEGQRVRLARALMQTGVRLALLDEPFRGLDRVQRARLLAQARGWWKDATLLCVTHDVAETLSFGRVLVIEGGRIVEDGAPAQLAASASRYRELLNAEKGVRERLWEGKHWRRIQIEDGSVAGLQTEVAAAAPVTPVMALVAAQPVVRALP
jgi:ABC-type bacteriocin/lantibiotic exporter with double-glycine peptidase domain